MENNDVKFLYEKVLEALAPSEQAIIRVLNEHPIRNFEIAKLTGLSQPNTAVLVQRLLAKKLIQAVPIGRRSGYKLSEELLRITKEIKNQGDVC